MVLLTTMEEVHKTVQKCHPQVDRMYLRHLTDSNTEYIQMMGCSEYDLESILVCLFVCLSALPSATKSPSFMYFWL